MVDIARDPAILRRRRKRQIALGVVAVLVMIGVSIALARMEPAPPSVERATVLFDTVRRGPLVRQVRGNGTLVPEDTRWIPATTDGRVERILLRPGAVVSADSVILELSSSAVEQEALTTGRALQSAQASLISLRVNNQNSLLTQQSQVAALEYDFKQARMQTEADIALAKEKLISQLQLQTSQVKLEALQAKLDIEKRRLATASEALEAQLQVQQVAVEQARGAARACAAAAGIAQGHPRVCWCAAGGRCGGRRDDCAGQEPGARRRSDAFESVSQGGRDTGPRRGDWSTGGGRHPQRRHCRDASAARILRPPTALSPSTSA